MSKITIEQARETAEKVWKIIEDSSAYSFNASHSLCVSYDSLYGAYLKAHHPYEFYNTVLTLYSGTDDKSKKDLKKVGKIKQEMEKHFGIIIGQMRFGLDNSEFTIDKENGTMYQSLLGVKFMNYDSSKYLAELGQRMKGLNILDIIETLVSEKGVNKRQIDVLIKINYFEEYGERLSLLAYHDLRNTFYNTQLRKTGLEKKYEKLKEETKQLIPIDDISRLIKLFAGNETEKSFTKIDRDKLMEEMFEFVKGHDMRDEDVVEIELDLMDTVNSVVNLIYGEVLAVSKGNKSFMFKSYKTGKTGWFKGNKVAKGDIITIKGIQKVGRELKAKGIVKVSK